MATHIEAKIVAGLIYHFSGISLPAGTGVAYPGVNFEPDGNTYIRLAVAKNQPTNPHISGALTIYRGIFMAVVCWPVGLGAPAPLVKASELAGKIRDHFAFNDALSDRRVIVHDGIEIFIGLDDAPRVAGDDQGSVYSEIPVLVPYTVLP